MAGRDIRSGGMSSPGAAAGVVYFVRRRFARESARPAAAPCGPGPGPAGTRLGADETLRDRPSVQEDDAGHHLDPVAGQRGDALDIDVAGRRLEQHAASPRTSGSGRRIRATKRSPIRRVGIMLSDGMYQSLQ